jgi:XTP/dITP diphosphohydrolase
MTRFELLIATRNAGKIDELREALATLPVILHFLQEFKDISEVAEVGQTYQENATLKAAGYSRQTGITALADDSGLEVDALLGAPGVLSARFGGESLSDSERTRALLAALHNVGPASRTARFVCCMTLYGSLPFHSAELSRPKVLAVSLGVCEGSLAMEPTGTEGFGFDPIFIPNGYTASFASLDQGIKRKISHRARAAELMRQQLERYLDSNLTAGGTAS